MTDRSIEELAKLGQKSLETAEKAGGWLDQVFGGGFRHLGGAFEDSMAGYRMRNRMRVVEKTQAAIKRARFAGNTRQLDPRIGVQVYDAIADESDDMLQDVWAEYIKNAINPKMPHPDRLLIDVIRRLEPSDWPILRIVFSRAVGDLVSSDFEASESELTSALDRMEVIGLFDYDDDTVQYIVAKSNVGSRLTITVGKAEYTATRLLRRLGEATRDLWSNGD
ncbi:DUF4393 domain-containing protein [Rhizobium sp. WYJ-E13]|uniref:DUF4393 domain-containing protein n=1 Tax=Rhizobium sp. WYJ-E13 TaxID=2849093 RepID=UPI001C1EE838|nr:DUF4393 domain-containing protein [Rhizobium sp. WYJ-E13]QWW68259.1 DUF4393 domain-containing protein [Rhizobium sp. WYJ-E13]